MGSHSAELPPTGLRWRINWEDSQGYSADSYCFGKRGCIGKSHFEIVTSVSKIFSRTGFSINNVDNWLYVLAGPWGISSLESQFKRWDSEDIAANWRFHLEDPDSLESFCVSWFRFHAVSLISFLCLGQQRKEKNHSSDAWLWRQIVHLLKRTSRNKGL